MSNFDVETLNLIHQDVSFQLQCVAVHYELSEQQCLQAEVIVDDLSAHASINLNDGYHLVLQPAYPGFNGVNTWFKWHTTKHPATGDAIVFSQMRCVAELQILDPESHDRQSLISFGIEAPNLQQVIQKALTKITQHCGLRLVALPQTKLNKATN